MFPDRATVRRANTANYIYKERCLDSSPTLSGNFSVVAASSMYSAGTASPPGARSNRKFLTPARRGLEGERIIVRPPAPVGIWFAVHDTPATTITARLAAQLPVYRSLQRDRFKIRLGQVLEIAIYRALLAQSGLPDFFGSFLDLAEHDDRTPYTKEETPRRDRRADQAPAASAGTGGSISLSGIRRRAGRASRRKIFANGCIRIAPKLSIC